MKSLKTKLAVLGLIPILVVFFLILFILLPSIKEDLMAEKESQTQELVNVGISILEYYYLLEKRQ